MDEVKRPVRDAFKRSRIVESSHAGQQRARAAVYARARLIRRMFFDDHLDVRIIAIRTNQTDADVRRIIRGQSMGWLETES